MQRSVVVSGATSVPSKSASVLIRNRPSRSVSRRMRSRALAVVALAVVVLALGRVARDEHAARRVGVVGLAVVRREPVDAHGVAGVQLGREPVERRRDVGAHDAAIVDGQDLVDTVGQPQAAGLDAAVVDRDEDRHDPIDAGIRDQILVRAVAGAARLLVVELVLERDGRLTERGGSRTTATAPSTSDAMPAWHTDTFSVRQMRGPSGVLSA